MGLMEKIFLPSNNQHDGEEFKYLNSKRYSNLVVLRILVMILLTYIPSFVMEMTARGMVTISLFRLGLLAIIIAFNYVFISQNEEAGEELCSRMMYFTFISYFVMSLTFFMIQRSLESVLDIVICLSVLGVFQSKRLMLLVGTPALFITIGVVAENYDSFVLHTDAVALTYYVTTLSLLFIISFIASIHMKRLYKLLSDRVEATDSLSQRYESLLHAVASSLEKIAIDHDDDSSQHIRRISKYSVILAKTIGLPASEVSEIALGAPLHDFGKVAVPTDILCKPGQLSKDEFEVIKTHSLEGYKMISGMKLGSKVENIILYHHEKWDGTGYPYGLSGRKIPLEARIIAIADVYDACRSSRPYKDPWSHERIREHIKDNSAKHFDPLLVNAFLQCEDQFREIFDTSIDTSKAVVNH